MREPFLHPKNRDRKGPLDIKNRWKDSRFGKYDFFLENFERIGIGMAEMEMGRERERKKEREREG